MRVAEANQAEKRLDKRARECGLDLPAAVVVAIDVAANTGASKQVQIILASQQSHVVDLRDPRRKKLQRAGDQILFIAPPSGVIVGAIDLVEDKVVRGRSCRLAAFAVASNMDRFDQSVDFLRSQQTW